MIATWTALAGCAIAAWIDVKSRRIPNWLTAALAVAALAVHAAAGLRSLVASAIVMLVLIALGTLAYSLGGAGGGDVKLAVAASGMLAYPLFVPFLLYTAVGGGLLALGVLAFYRLRDESPRPSHMPYGVAFAFGAAMVVLSQSVAPFLRISL